RALEPVDSVPRDRRPGDPRGRLARGHPLAAGRPRGRGGETQTQAGGRRFALRRPALGLAALLAACVVAASVQAAFTANKTTPQTIVAVTDFLPPTVAASQVSGPGGAGTVQPGKSYTVCAQVSDQGNPPSGVATVRADVGQIAGVASTVTLAQRTCTG